MQDDGTLVDDETTHQGNPRGAWVTANPGGSTDIQQEDGSLVDDETTHQGDRTGTTVTQGQNGTATIDYGDGTSEFVGD
jgi:hypothetical protein